MHSNGYIHGDLRPRNFLIDEYGIVKIADFKFTQKIPKEALGSKKIEERGTCAYMSPELFTPQAANSFQSDFWALGCVLYELRRGFPPFGNNATPIESLLENIRTVEPVNSPIVELLDPDAKGSNKYQKSPNSSVPSLTNELSDILMWLLEKSPIERCSW